MDPIEPTHDLEPDPGGGALLPAGPAEEFRRNHAAIARYLEQSHRDSAANRAQARELVGALEQVQASHEYLGKALRQERRRGRFLLLGLLVAPILAGLLVWAVWERIDAMRGDLGDDVEGLRRAQLQMRRTDLIDAHDARVASLDDELRRTRAALESEREGLREEQTSRAARESELLERIDGLEHERGEILGLRARFEALRERAGAETARADALDRELRTLERELGAARERAESGARREPRPIRPAADRTPAVAATPPAAPLDPGTDGTDAPEPPERTADPFPGAVRGEQDLERIEGDLNRLLEASDDAVSYRLEKLGGVSGVTLLDVRIGGIDPSGRTIRALEAEGAVLRGPLHAHAGRRCGRVAPQRPQLRRLRVVLPAARTPRRAGFDSRLAAARCYAPPERLRGQARAKTSGPVDRGDHRLNRPACPLVGSERADTLQTLPARG
jgi:hypothetical protein